MLISWCTNFNVTSESPPDGHVRNTTMCIFPVWATHIWSCDIHIFYVM